MEEIFIISLLLYTNKIYNHFIKEISKKCFNFYDIKEPPHYERGYGVKVVVDGYNNKRGNNMNE